MGTQTSLKKTAQRLRDEAARYPCFSWTPTAGLAADCLDEVVNFHGIASVPLPEKYRIAKENRLLELVAQTEHTQATAAEVAVAALQEIARGKDTPQRHIATTALRILRDALEDDDLTPPEETNG